MYRFLCLIVMVFSFINSNAYAEEAAKPTLAMTSTAFLDGGIFPTLYTCDGKDISPQLDWTDVPAKTQAFALILKDTGATKGTFYHWVVYNLPKNVVSLAEGLSKAPSGAVFGKNDKALTQYNGPCPPKGSSHTYIFTLYALDGKLSLPAGAEGKAVEEAVKGHVVAEAKLTGVYSRWLT